MQYPNQSFVSLPANPNGRDLFIGDLHVCVQLLEKLMRVIVRIPRLR